MTEAARNEKVTVRFYNPQLAATLEAQDDALHSSRTPFGVTRFYPEGDWLEGKASQQAAEYYSQIPSYEVEGYTPFVDTAVVEQDWMTFHERIAKQERQGTQSNDPMAEVMKHMITAQMGGAGLKELIEEAARKIVADSMRPVVPVTPADEVTMGEVNEIPFNEAEALVEKADPAWDAQTKEENQVRAKLVTLARDNGPLTREVKALSKKAKTAKAE